MKTEIQIADPDFELISDILQDHQVTWHLCFSFPQKEDTMTTSYFLIIYFAVIKSYIEVK